MEEDMEKIVFPACAGVIPNCANGKTSYLRIPRVCGGDPGRIICRTIRLMYSPRVRG